jgi:hypothetical protein
MGDMGYHGSGGFDGVRYVAGTEARVAEARVRQSGRERRGAWPSLTAVLLAVGGIAGGLIVLGWILTAFNGGA